MRYIFTISFLYNIFLTAIPHVQLQALQERLESESGMAVSETAFPELLAQLSTLTPCAPDQVKALGIATNAFRGIVDMIKLLYNSVTNASQCTYFGG